MSVFVGVLLVGSSLFGPFLEVQARRFNRFSRSFTNSRLGFDALQCLGREPGVASCMT